MKEYLIYCITLLVIIGISCYYIFLRQKMEKEIHYAFITVALGTQLLVYNFGVALISDFIYSHENLFYLLTISFAVTIILKVGFLLTYIVYDFTKISLHRNWRKSSIKIQLLMLFSIIITLIISPQFFFSLIYITVYGMYDINFLIDKGYTIHDFQYFSFAIYFSLPLPEETLGYVQQQISSNYYLRIVQMAHISVSKVLEYVIIGYFIAKAIESINILTKKKVKKDKSIAQELRQFFQIYNNGGLSKEEYEKIKKEILV
ncbi:hypothetical protein ACJ7K1_11660 [Paenibacillus elgii]